MADSPPIQRSLLLELLSFRRVARSWATAIIPSAYHNLSFSSSGMLCSFIATWRHSARISSMPQLRRLSFDQLSYPDAEVHLELTPVNNQSYSSWTNESHAQIIAVAPVTMLDIEKLIGLCSCTFTHLKFNFITGVGFSPCMIDTLQAAKSLKVLIILGFSIGAEINQSQSIQSLLNVTKGLRSLSLNVPALLPLQINPASLRHLEHLSFVCGRNNIVSATDLCRIQAHSLNHLELTTHGIRSEVNTLLMPLRSSLSILFVESIQKLLLCDARARSSSFPKLKLIQTIDSTSCQGGLAWLQLGIFQNMRVFVTSYWFSADYWRTSLEALKKQVITESSVFKHIIFITGNGALAEDQLLEELFQQHGLACHFRPHWTRSEMLRFESSE